MDLADDLPDLSPDEERLLGQLVEYHQALADGTPIPTDTQQTTDAAENLDDQLARGKHLLELMAAIGQERDDELPIGAGSADAPHPFESDRLGDGLAAPQQANQAPRQLGRFVIQRELGVGGHGVVLLAFDPVLKRHVALKVPRSEALVSSALRRRFLRAGTRRRPADTSEPGFGVRSWRGGADRLHRLGILLGAEPGQLAARAASANFSGASGFADCPAR